MRVNIRRVPGHLDAVEVVSAFLNGRPACERRTHVKPPELRAYVVPFVAGFQGLIRPCRRRVIAEQKIAPATARLVERYEHSMNLILVACLPRSATAVPVVVVNVQRVVRIVEDQSESAV
jgi:hypothetical protein